ncbi:SAV_2336 N-terminal domain-related protein [Microbispora sp. NPDC088329]|uniref:SAV_2336 N-terminal domain-related protein n=1 Tax=Microbispora sp. NPDC088329 TaxID=3154869 RepID=UPI003430F60F
MKRKRTVTTGIDRLRLALSAVGPPLTAVELAECLWLAQFLHGRDRVREDTSPADREPIGKSTAIPELLDRETQPVAKNQVEIYSRATSDSTGESAVPVQVSTGPMLSNGLRLNRALRPLRHRVPAQRRWIVDERATADSIAGQFPHHRSPWIPVLIPAMERRLELTLVIDFGSSMDLWQPLGEELRQLYISVGAFRNVQLVRLKDGPQGITVGSAGAPGALTDPSGRRLVLLLSDCSGTHWWTGRMAHTIRRWASSSPTAILQPLPERMWHRTATSVTVHEASLARPFAANTSLRLQPRVLHKEMTDQAVPVPVVGLSASWFANWAHVMAGNVRPIGVTHLEDQPNALEAWLQDEHSQPIEKRILRFRAVASSQAYSLAGYLATASFPSLSLMRLMQRALLPNSSPEHLAEVILSGLLQPVEQEPGFYTFVPGGRNLLLRSMSRTSRQTAIRVLQAVSRELAARAGMGINTFRSYVPDVPPDSNGGISTAGDPFALIDSDVFGLTPPASPIRPREPDRSSTEQLYERLTTLVTAQSQILWITSPTGAVTEDAPQWRVLTGQGLEEYLAHGWLDAVHPDDRAAAEGAWREALRGRTMFEWSYRVRTRASGYRHFEVRAVPIVRHGRVVEWVGANTDVTPRREAEEMRGRLTDELGAAALRTARLQGATAQLAEALTVEQVVQVIIDIGRTALAADHSSVALLDPDRATLKVINSGGTTDNRGEEIDLANPNVMTMAVNSRRPVFAESPDMLRAQLVDAGADEAQISGFLAQTDERAWVGLPLVAAGRALGALRFSFERTQKISQADGVFLEALAGQCALAVERATLFEREHKTAETLQRSLLPDRLPVVRGLTLAYRFRSGSRHVQVGGDWYDAFVLQDGRVAAVVGDVMGKGVKAAAGMGRIRNAMRALALTNPPPAAVLTGLDRVFEATEEEEQVTTLAYMVVEPGTGEGTLALAGHPPPLLVSPQGVGLLHETDPGTPLGWATSRKQFRFCVPPGHTAVLYSDGLVENRKRGLDAGLRELSSVVAEAPPEVLSSPHLLLDFLVDRMLSGYEQDDDVTVLAIHVPSSAGDDPA